MAVRRLEPATVAVLEEAGYKTLDDIIDLEREDFLRLAGIAPEEADRLMTIIDEKNRGYALGATGIVFTDERTLDGKPQRITTSMIPQPDGRLFMTQDRSVMGGAWQHVGEVYYVTRK